MFGDKLKENRSLRPFGLGLVDKTKDFAQEGRGKPNRWVRDGYIEDKVISRL